MYQYIDEFLCNVYLGRCRIAIYSRHRFRYSLDSVMVFITVWDLYTPAGDPTDRCRCRRRNLLQQN